ncbi:MAG TPA: tetratricopeptide repeat protein [Patescibacteria group bacterium]|nr:tetratricopeptide repeat protein [Patescibacteria group bacterium]
MKKNIPGIYIFLFFLFLAVVLYCQVLRGDFVADDKFLIVQNELIKDWHKAPLLFSTDLFKFSVFDEGYKYYRPLMSLSYALEYHIWKLNPAGYHLTNVLIHALVTFLGFALVYRVFSSFSLALLSALLFCVHPLHTETVCYIADRGELLLAVWVLLSLLSYSAYAASSKKTYYLLSLASFACALLSREAGFLALIPLYIACIGMKAKVPRGSLVSHCISFASLFALYITLRLTVLVPVWIAPQGGYGIGRDVLNFWSVIREYLSLLIAPQGLHVLRMIKPVSGYWSAGAFAAVVLAVALTAITIFAFKKRKYAVFTGITWFILMLSYLIRFMYKFPGSLAAEEHWVYLASWGVFLVAAYLLLRIRSMTVLLILSAALVCGYGFSTFANAGGWRQELPFYRRNLALMEPSVSFITRSFLISALAQRGFYAQALAEARQSARREPENLVTYIQLGDIYRAMKQYDRARRAYAAALERDYFYWQANRRLKLLAQEQGQVFKDELDPAFSPKEKEIIALMRLGEFSQALGIIGKELAAGPTPQMYILAGISFGKLQVYPQAVRALKAARALDPSDRRALYNLAVIYEKLKQYDNADKAWQALNAVP